MKTDHPIYLYLRSGPEAFRVLSGGLQLDGAPIRLDARWADKLARAIIQIRSIRRRLADAT